MNVYCKNENSMFFSSLKDSLTVLGASKKDKLQIDYNTVYIITDGDFANAEKHKVSRLQAGQSESITYNAKYNSRHAYGYENYCDWEDVRAQTPVRVPTDVDTETHSMINLQNDKPLKAIVDYNGKIYSKSLRYWENNNLINGVYLYIKNWGFKFAGIDTFTAKAYVKNIKGLTFDYKDGNFNFNILNTVGFVPFEKNVENIQFHYFINGVLLKTLEDYNRAVILNRDLKAPAKTIDYRILSYISKHPIIDIDSTDRTSAMFDGKLFTGNTTELGFEKIYYFNNGIFVKWTRREDLIIKVETPVIVLPTTTNSKLFDEDLFDDSIKAIEDFEKYNKEIFNSEIVTGELENEIVISEMILECFEKHAEDISETIIELSDWKDNENVKTAINTLNLINHTLKDFVEKHNIK